MKRALVVGCADCIWRDSERAQAMAAFDAVYCVKAAGVVWPEPFKVWATLHPEHMAAFVTERRHRGLPGGYEIVGPLSGELSPTNAQIAVDRRVSYLWPKMNASGSSGLFAVKIAIEDGFDRVVLAGVPMTEDKHFMRGKPWIARASFVDGWKQALPHIKGKVRSMSGWTKEILGEPTPEWLAGEPQS